jgi:hypothetical protein
LAKAEHAEETHFTIQASGLKNTTTIQGYAEWVKVFGTILYSTPGAYELHLGCLDEKTREAVFPATCHAKHTGEGRPVWPTNKEMHTGLVYVPKRNQRTRLLP